MPLVVALSSREASADPDPLFPRLGLACRKESAEMSNEGKDDGDVLVPVPSHAPPRDVTRADLVVDDVAIAAPIPKAIVSLAATPTPPPREVGKNDFRCIGLVRGRPGILRVLDAPPGSRWADGATDRNEKRVFARGAGVFHVTEAIPLLRRQLDRPVPDKASYDGFDILATDVTTVRALADLDDAASAEPVRAFLRDHETGYAFYPWQESIEAFGRLDPSVAQAYAIDVIDRAARDPKHFNDRDQTVLTVLPLFTSPSDEARAALAALAKDMAADTSDIGWYFECDVLATAVRMGDATVRSEFAPIFADTAHDTERSVMCYSELVRVTFPGDDPSEVDTLLLRHRYPQMLHLAERLRGDDKAGTPQRGADVARGKIKAWLGQQLAKPDAYPDDVVYGLTTLAVLGDESALLKLYAIVDDPSDDRADAWVAARFAIEHHLPKAEDHAAQRLAWGIDHHVESSNSGAGFRMDEVGADTVFYRGEVYMNEQARLVDALARIGDARFALGLLERDARAHPLAAHYLARQRPSAACGIVAGAAAAADAENLVDAFWSLSVLGSTCKPDLLKLASSTSVPEKVRELALDDLAMLRATEAWDLTVKPVVPWSRYQKPADIVSILLHARE